MVGLETVLDWFGLSWLGQADQCPELNAMMTVNPGKILGIDSQPLAPGVSADITIIDPELEEKVDPEDFHSKGRNTPFVGKLLKGLPVMTIIEGRIVFKR
jgi:dihydroorotase